jgi:hypothetical protein
MRRVTDSGRPTCGARHGNGNAVARIWAAGAVTDLGRVAALSRGVEPWGVVGSPRLCARARLGRVGGGRGREFG